MKPASIFAHGLVVTALILMGPAFAADEVSFVKSQPASAAAPSSWERAGVQHDLHVRTLAGPEEQEKLALTAVHGEVVALATLAAPGPGTYALGLHDLVAHPTNEGGRAVEVFLGERPEPLARVNDSRPDTDEPLAGDVTLPLELTAEDLPDGQVTVKFRAASYAAVYLQAVSLRREGEELARTNRFQLFHGPEEVPEGFGPEGVRLGYDVVERYLTVTLDTSGPGKHDLTLEGLVAHPTDKGGRALEVFLDGVFVPAIQPVLRIDDSDPNREEPGAADFTTTLEIDSGNLLDRAVTLRLKGATRAPVTLRGLRLARAGEPAGMDGSQVNDLIVWHKDPWVMTSHREKPSEATDDAILAVSAARNETESVALMLTNARQDGADLTVQIEVEDLQADEGDGRIPAAEVEVRELVSIPERSGRRVLDPLKPVSEVEVPAGETRQAWLLIHVGDVPAGRYRGNIRLTPERGEPETAPLDLTVWPLRLPDQMPLAVHNWQSFPTRPDTVESRAVYDATWADLLEHGVNVFPLHVDEDATHREEILRRAREHGLQLFFSFDYRKKEMDALAGGSADAREWFENVTRQAVAMFREHGLDYEDFAFYLYDETIGPNFIAVAQVLRGIDPQVRIFSDWGWEVEGMEPAAPYVDIWCPSVHALRADADGSRLAFMKGTGKPVWMYDAGTNQRVVPPYPYYRLQPWRAWQWGLQGCCFWKYIGDLTGAVCYPGEVGRPDDQPLVTGRRWEAWREGLEDYALLHLYREALAGAPAEVREEGEEWLKEAVKDVLAAPDDPAPLHRVRAAVAKRLFSGILP